MLERAGSAAELKSGAVQVILPDWVAVTIEEAKIFLRKVAEVIEPIGSVLYNPPHAKRLLKSFEIKLLKDTIPQFIGLKVMDGDENGSRK